MALITRILAPTDFSTFADHALDYACELGARFAAPLVLVHVTSGATMPIPEGYVLVSAAQLIDMRARIDEGMAATRKRAEARGATVDAIDVIEGTVWHEIVQAAPRHQCDLIVLGTHGRTGVSHAILGSIAEKVVRKASCAVLTVGARVKAH